MAPGGSYWLYGRGQGRPPGNAASPPSAVDGALESGCGGAVPRRKRPRTPFCPYALQIAGDWRAAAEAWERIGCPYEQALVLLAGEEGPSDPHWQSSRDLEPFLRRRSPVSACTSEARVRLPRGPHPRTRSNPQG